MKFFSGTIGGMVSLYPRYCKELRKYDIESAYFLVSATADEDMPSSISIPDIRKKSISVRS